ncbi:MAG: hypothetical protein LDL39_10890 [Magnetospirillum sp.]|nr:hypothetical protein [Magnetospirillum sp.]
MIVNDTESFRWIFAACETIRLWNAHDQFWVTQASKDAGLDDDEVKEFAKTYQTSRSTSKESRKTVNEYIKENKKSKAEKIYQDSIESGISKAEQGINGRIVYSNVFVSKLLWFYKPQEWCMHDTLSKNSLRAITGLNVDDKNFHGEYNKIFTQLEIDKIGQLLKSLDITYAFENRIADKYLMSAGKIIRSKKKIPKPIDQDDWSKWVVERHKGPNADLGAALEIAAELPRVRG